MDKPDHDPTQRKAEWLSSEDVMQVVRDVSISRNDDASLATLFIVIDRLKLLGVIS